LLAMKKGGPFQTASDTFGFSELRQAQASAN
jgi:hypothetical protein